MLPFHNVVEQDFSAVNQTVIDELHSHVNLVENIGQYIIEGGGKRLRPLVVLLSASTCGYQAKQHIRLAAIIEFIHTATLLHDDVVDMSAARRGRETANNKWGNSPSVLVGDFLYSRAFQLLVELGNMDIMRVLSNTTNMIAEGEVQQLVNAGDPEVSEENYLTVIHKKTAILFEAATQSGAILANAKPEEIQAMADYGKHLGMAFQLQDDVLDYVGDATTLGKNIGDDLAEGKPTLPLIYAMREGLSTDADIVRQAILQKDVSAIDQVIDVVRKTGGLTYTEQLAKRQVSLAINALQIFEESEYRQALMDLAQFAITRQY